MDVDSRFLNMRTREERRQLDHSQEKINKGKIDEEEINETNSHEKKMIEELNFVKKYLRSHRINLNIRQVN